MTTQFSPEVQQRVDGLLHLGYLEDTISFCGHTFTIKTLYAHEDLLVGLLTKEYVETLAQVKAWATANVALALKAIDGQKDFCPPASHDELDNARGRFQYVARTWQYPTVEYLFQEHARLNAERQEAYESLQNLSGRSLRQPTPSQDS